MKTLNIVAVLSASLLLATASLAQSPQTQPQQPVVKKGTPTAHHTTNTEAQKSAVKPEAAKNEASTTEKKKSEQNGTTEMKAGTKKAQDHKHATKNPEAKKKETKVTK